ncbi:MAG: hypothetical protein AABW75_00470 [Nanoarchaeota archaeon]
MSFIGNLSPELEARLHRVYARTEAQKAEEKNRVAQQPAATAPIQDNKGADHDIEVRDVSLGSIEPGKLESYIILPAGNYGKRDYPELLIGINRISYTDKRVQNAVKKLYPQQQFSDNDQGFIGGINHQQALDITKEIGGFTLSVLLEREFLRHLNKGINDRNYHVYNGKGDRIRSDVLQSVNNEIIEVRNLWRSEWNADRFSENNGEMQVTTYIFDNRKFKEVTESLGDYLAKNKQISYGDWLNRAAKHGLPLSGCKNGEFYFWIPINGRVAGFVAGSVRAGLSCYWSPLSSNSSLGVREAREKI